MAEPELGLLRYVPSVPDETAYYDGKVLLHANGDASELPKRVAEVVRVGGGRLLLSTLHVATTPRQLRLLADLLEQAGDGTQTVERREYL